MAESPQNSAVNSRTEHASMGEKHKTEPQNPEAKRAKMQSQEPCAEATEEKYKNKEADVGEEEESPERPGDGANSNDHSAVHPEEETNIPSNILEKGIIYFFIKGRVNIDEPSDVKDIARSYIMLRPIATDAELGKGPIGDAGNTRLVVLPKKVLPSSGKERFMAFVEKSGASYDEIKGQFFARKEYKTKTAGTRYTPAATPIGEGIYAVTTTGRESHLIYLLTLPEKLDEVQEELGLKESGSFILSTKNPKYPGPAYARLPKGPDYPKGVLDEFRGLRWIPSQPVHLNYANTQLLLIGESGIGKAVKPQKEEEEEKEEAIEVLEHLEEGDLVRMRHLPGDQSASVFADLQVHADNYPKLQTTF